MELPGTGLADCFQYEQKISCKVQLDGLEADLVSKVGCKETLGGLCGLEALPVHGGTEGRVSTDACLV